MRKVWKSDPLVLVEAKGTRGVRSGTEVPNSMKTREVIWCGRWDSNPHALRRHPLKMVRLPVPPLPHEGAEAPSV